MVYIGTSPYRTTALDRKGRLSRRAESRRVKQRTAADGRPLLTVARRSPSLAGLSPVARRSRPSSSVVGAAASSSAAPASVAAASSSSAAAAGTSAADPDQTLKAKLEDLRDKHKRDVDERTQKQAEVDALTRQIRGAESEMKGVQAELDKRANRRNLQAELDATEAKAQQLRAQLNNA